MVGTLVAGLLVALFGAFASANDRPGAWHDVPPPDQSDWSDQRKRKFASTHDHNLGAPKAVLEVPSLGLAVQVYGDTHHMALERGAGWVEHTAALGRGGNVAIAGHRDSFFRSMENIQTDARLVLRTPDQRLEYRVTSISIVDALDTDSLLPTTESILTLITCYPFRYRGYAPDRYVVRAHLSDEFPIESRLGRVDSSVYTASQ